MRTREEITIVHDAQIIARPPNIGVAAELLAKLPGARVFINTQQEYASHELRRYFPEWFDG